MKIIAGAQIDFQGAMLIDGAPMQFGSTHDALRAGVGMVHQELSIAPDLTVAENMFLGRQLTNRLGIVDWRRMAREAAAALNSLGIEVDPRARAGALPLGLQQLVELGRVLFSGARIIILDEPTSALSPPEVQLLFKVLTTLKGKGASLIFISHFLDDVKAITDRITVVRSGRAVATTKSALIEKSWIISQMIGPTQSHSDIGANVEKAVLAKRGNPTPALEARALRGASLSGVSLRVSAGEILGVYGFMGSGHSEVGQILVGKTRASAGQILMSEKHVRNLEHGVRQTSRHRPPAQLAPTDAVRHAAHLQERFHQDPRKAGHDPSASGSRTRDRLGANRRTWGSTASARFDRGASLGRKPTEGGARPLAHASA